MNCKKYQKIDALSAAGKEAPDGFITITELREGRIPWHYALDHPKTTRLAVKGMMDCGYEISNRQGRCLTLDIYDDELSEDERKDIVKDYLYQWSMDLAKNNQAQLDLATAKTPDECYKCGFKATTGHVGLLPDIEQVYTKCVCSGCLAATNGPSKVRFPEMQAKFEWRISAVHQPNIPEEWR